MLDAGELPGWVQNMMGHETLKMILERYYSYIRNYQWDGGSAFMENVYDLVCQRQKPRRGIRPSDLAILHQIYTKPETGSWWIHLTSR